MEQFFVPLWDLGSWFSSSASQHSNFPPLCHQTAQQAPFLHLPADVILLVRDHLDAPSSLSLALTCKCLYALHTPSYYKQLLLEEQREFLLRLERDPMAKGTYYCHYCHKLHPFQQTWGPRAKNGIYDYDCGTRDRIAPVGNAFGLTFTHAKLAMNHHLYGPGYGIPIANLCVEHDERRDAIDIHCATSAKILDDELFLQRTYTFAIPDSHVLEFRKGAGARDFRLCEHTSFFSNHSIYRQYVPELQRRGGIVACREVPGSCGLCLMDYDITIQRERRRGDGDGDVWLVTIRAYHQVGSCRSPDDWKWARFTEACRPLLLFPNRPHRRGSIHDPGTVRGRWSDGEAPNPKAVSREGGMAKKSLTFWSSHMGLW